MATMRISGHCQDRCSIRVDHGRGYDGYVPYEIGIGGGDYLDLEIDIETGKIIGWNPTEVKEALQDLRLLP